ncbi:hypothetical protein [Rhizobacter sp. Root1221]|uniref:hypothetical protein n=1 Tax=Rhizobacter sp. Root1221 TaxID=1736433 RepID=UPI000B124C1E|nr:hypothetical protein [Rhizobacter sp. Root1221]
MITLPSLPRRPAVLATIAAALVAIGLAVALLPATHSRWWLPAGVVLSITAHVLLARALKAILASISPLASGAPEAATYERSVYGTPGRNTLEIAGAAVLSGVLAGTGITLGAGWAVGAGFLALVVALALDVQRWERVAASADWVWFQRGYGQKVHQVAIDNIRDISIHEDDAGGFSMRHGTHNRVCRLNLRMADKRIVALPKTDAFADLDDVESVANHIRTRQQLMEELAARRGGGARSETAPAPAAEAPAPDDKAMLRELKKLRRAASKDGVPTLQSEIGRPPQP